MARLKKNLFERVKQHYVEDRSNDIYWWIDDSEWEKFRADFSDFFLDMPDFKKAEREISGKEYNEFLVGQPFGDFEGTITSHECPECSALMVRSVSQEGFIEVSEEPLFCTECEYENEDFKTYENRVTSHWEELRNSPPATKYREVGQTLEDFVDKYKFDLEDCAHKICVVCNKELYAKDFYRTDKYAGIEFGHVKDEGCKNSGAGIFIPQGKEVEKWAGLI